MIKEEPIIDRSIHFLIPSLSAGIIKKKQITRLFILKIFLQDEPSHILSLPETFAIQQSPLEVSYYDY